jgi:hypothetical protein
VGTHPAVGDVNRDGRLDIAALQRKGRGPSVWLGDGKGGWKSASTGLLVPDFSCGVGVDLADVNGDGNLDLGIADHCRGLFVFFGDGKGMWKLGPAVTRQTGIGYEDLAVADVNGDQKMDLVAISSFREGLAAFLGDGQGRWKLTDIGLSDSGYGTDIKIGDVNEDGRPDIVSTFIAEQASKLPREKSHNVVWLSQPSGRFEPSTPDAERRQVVRRSLGDVNGDRHLVSCSAATSGRIARRCWSISVTAASAGRSPWTVCRPRTETSASRASTTDLDGDGHLDLISGDQPGRHPPRMDGRRSGPLEQCPDTGLPKGGASSAAGVSPCATWTATHGRTSWWASAGRAGAPSRSGSIGSDSRPVWVGPLGFRVFGLRLTPEAALREQGKTSHLIEMSKKVSLLDPPVAV